MLLFSSPFLFGFSFLADLKNEKGNELYKKGQVGKARTEYAGAMKSDPKSPEIAYNLGNALYKEGAFKESLGAYEKGAKTQKDPSFLSKAFYNLGNSLYRNQDPAKAIEFYKQALRLDPRDEDAKYNLELLLKKTPPKDQDKQKDQQKQDQQQQKNQDQKKQDQGGSSGSEGKDQDKKDSKDEKPSEGQKSGGEEQEQSEPDEKQGEEQKKNEEPQGQEEQKKPGQDQGQDMNGAQGEEKEKEPAAGADEAKPKTEADLRTEQILSALENQEQQVLKFQNNPDNPRMRGRQTAEKDW